jgi:hypothetical protein
MTPIQIPTCFWCGKPVHEVATAAHIERRSVIMNYDPCGRCRPSMMIGVTCVEIDSVAKVRRPPLQDAGPLSLIAPTGRWAVISSESVDRLPLQEQQKVSVRAAKRALLDPQVFAMLFGEKPKEGMNDDQGHELRLQGELAANGRDARGLQGPEQSALIREAAPADGVS